MICDVSTSEAKLSKLSSHMAFTSVKLKHANPVPNTYNVLFWGTDFKPMCSPSCGIS